jgi:aspartate ammonia-lyase
VVDVIQGGAGTSTNMNANEVIANRALELLGHAKGDYAAPAPERTTSTSAEHQRRLPHGAALAAVRASAACSSRWPTCAPPSRPRPRSSSDVLKMGRTQLQDAVPMTLGQEFSTYAVMLGRGRGSGCARRSS